MTLLYAVMKNTCLIVQKDGAKFSLLNPEKEVNSTYGFETPAPDNQWIYDHCGFWVYRTHLFFYGNFCIACFTPENDTSLNDGYEWIRLDQLSSIDAESEAIHGLLLAQNGAQSKTVPWLKAEGYSAYLDWAKAVLAEQDYSLCGAFQQSKNTYASSIFKIPTSKGTVYLKISASVYVNDAATEQQLANRIGSLPDFIAVSPDGMASLTKEMSGVDCQIGTPAQYKRWLVEWGKQQVHTIGSNTYSLTDCTPQKLLADIPDFLNQLQKIYNAAGKTLDAYKCEILKSKLSVVRTALTQLCIYPIPNAVCHADIRPGNVRITGDAESLYDWGLAFWGHPFYDAMHFLHVVRRQLTETERAEIIEAYLSQWVDFADKHVLFEAYTAAEQYKDYFMLTADYRWVAYILKICEDNPKSGTMDDWMFDRRFYYFDRVLHRFIEE